MCPAGGPGPSPARRPADDPASPRPPEGASDRPRGEQDAGRACPRPGGQTGGWWGGGALAAARAPRGSPTALSSPAAAARQARGRPLACCGPKRPVFGPELDGSGPQSAVVCGGAVRGRSARAGGCGRADGTAAGPGAAGAGAGGGFAGRGGWDEARLASEVTARRWGVRAEARAVTAAARRGGLNAAGDAASRKQSKACSRQEATICWKSEVLISCLMDPIVIAKTHCWAYALYRLINCILNLINSEIKFKKTMIDGFQETMIDGYTGL